MSLVRRISDGLANIVTGLGGRNDKSAYSQYQFGIVTQQDVEASYRTSWLCRKIVDLPPYDMCRAWREWQAGNAEIESIEEVERVHGIAGKVQRGLVLARLYGGAGMVLGINDEDPSTPLDLNRVGKDSLRYAHVLSRHQLSVGALILDPADPLFLQPEYYQISAALSTNVVDVHPSRVIAFHGQPVPQGSLLQGSVSGDTFWGDPLMQTIQDAVKNADLTQAGIAQLVHEAKIDVVSIPGLNSSMGTADYEARLMKRFQLANMLKSSVNALIIDGEETWASKAANFTQLPDVARLYLQIAAGAADIPATRLLGQSPQGMNATGESDLRNYYDMLASRQNTDLRPALAPLDEVLIRTATGSRNPDIHYTFGSLWQLSATERATVDKTTADTAMVWVNTGLFPDIALAEAVQNRVVEDGTYPGLETALDDAEAANELPDILTEPLPTDPGLVAGNEGVGPKAMNPLPGRGAAKAKAAANDPGAKLKKAANDARAALARIAARDSMTDAELRDALDVTPE